MQVTFTTPFACHVIIDHLKFSVNTTMDDGDFILVTDFKYINISSSVPIFIEDGCYEHGKIMMEEMNIAIHGDFRRVRYFESFKFDELVIQSIPSQLFFCSSGYLVEYGSYKFVIIAPGVAHYTLEMPFMNHLDALILLNIAPTPNQLSTKLKNMQLCIQDAVNNKIPVLVTVSPLDGYLFDLLFLLQTVQYFTPTKLYLLFSTGLKSYTLINSIPESLNTELKNKAFDGKFGLEIHYELYDNCYNKDFQSKWLKEPGIILTMNNFCTNDLLASFDMICQMRHQRGLVFNINQRQWDLQYQHIDVKRDGFCDLDARMTIQQVLQHFKANHIQTMTLPDIHFDDVSTLRTIYPNLHMTDINAPHRYTISNLTVHRLLLSRQLESAQWQPFKTSNATFEFTWFEGNLQNDIINIFPMRRGILFCNLSAQLIKKACQVCFYNYALIDVVEQHREDVLTQIFVADVLVVHVFKGQILIESEELQMIKTLQAYLLQSNLIHQL